MVDRQYHRDYWHKRRKRVLDHMGGVCVRCGATENLEVDHIDPTTKLIEISARLTLESLIEELEKCQLLCVTCHREKTLAERPLRHGSMFAWQKKKCDCTTCSSAKRQWNDERNARRRKP